MSQKRKEPQTTKISNLGAIVLRKFFNFLGYAGVLFIISGVVFFFDDTIWTLLEKWVTPLSAALTIIGAVITALSVYIFKPSQHKPERFSLYVSAPLVIICGIIALVLLCIYGLIPPVIVNGFALLGISGALLRIQPRTTEA